MSLFYNETVGHSRMAENGNGSASTTNENNLGLGNNNNALQAALAAGTGNGANENNQGLGNNNNAVQAALAAASGEEEEEEAANLGLVNNNNALQAALAAGTGNGNNTNAVQAAVEEEEGKDEAEPRIGDYVEVTYKVGDADQTKKGTVYTTNDTVFRILLAGSSTTLHTFNMVKDGDSITFTDTITAFAHKPRIPPVTFVEYLGLTQNKRIQLYKDNKVVEDGAGEPKVFVVEAVNTSADQDKATLVNVADSSEKLELDFSEGGIPTKYNAEFDLIFVLGDKEPEVTQEQLLAAAEAATEGSAPPGEDDTQDDVVNLNDFLGFAIDSITEAQESEAQLQVAEGKQITEEDQIESFLRGLLMDLTFAQQKNPVTRKRIETLVQALNLLRKSVLVPNKEGKLVQRQLTIDRLADALRSTKMPIARPIYKTKRLAVTENIEPTPLDDLESLQLEVKSLQENLQSYNDHMDAEKTRQEKVVEEPGQEQLPRFYSFLREQNQKFLLGDLYQRGATTIQSDTDFFRHPVPGLSESSLYGLKNIKLVNEKTGKEETLSNYDPYDFITDIQPFSLRRALAKESDGDVLQTTTTEGYVVFPIEASSQGIVGAKRSGRLVETVKRSQMPKIAMRYALNDEFYGPIDESGRNLAKAVYYDELLDDKRQTNGADLIKFNDYLDTILKTLFLEGPADINPLKLDLGIENFELTKDQMHLVQQRIVAILDKLTNYIGSLGATAINELQKLGEPINNSLFPDQVKRYEELAKVYEPLGKMMAVLQDHNQNYSRIDIAIVAHCLRHIPDYFFAVLTQNTEKIEQEQTRLNDTLFKQDIYNIVEQQQYDRNQKIQYGPQRRPCGDKPEENHYFIMDIVRRRGDFKLRMKAMEQAISTFLETKRTDNWYHCIQCKDTLICQHEYLQYLQYKNPQDYASIQKQIILDFAGGSFGSNYICRNCGLPIADIGFDIKTELREGTTINIDLDEKKREEQEQKLLGIFKSIEDGRTGNQVYDDLQVAAKKLFERFDIDYDNELFRAKLFPRANFCIQQAMTEKEFLKTKGVKEETTEEKPKENAENREEEEQDAVAVEEAAGDEEEAVASRQSGGAKEGKPTGNKLAAKGKPKGKKPTSKKPAAKKINPEYQIYKTRTMLCALGAAILVELQTAIPALRIGDSDASDVFTGYPLDSREKEPLIGSKSINGVSIILQALLKLPRNEKPWNTLGLKSEQSSEEMFMELKPMMETVLVTLVTQNTTVETDLRLKRKQIAELDLEARQKNERLPPNFLPLLQTLAEGKEQGAAEPTIEIGAKGAIGNTLKAAKWIREANRYAQKTGRSILGYKFMEGSCCEVDGSLLEPGKFWIDNPIEPMPKRDSFPFQSPYRRNTVLNVHFQLEALKENEMKPSEEAKFNLFLSVCREGENAGRPHELDYENVCDWCGLKVDEKFLMPPTDIDKDGKVIPYKPEEIQKIYEDLRDKGITLEGTQFEDLLKKTNSLSTFDQYENPEAISRMDVIESLKALDPPPTSLDTLRVDTNQPDKEQEVGNWNKWVTKYFEFVANQDDQRKLNAIKRLSFLQDEIVYFPDKKVADTLNEAGTYKKTELKESEMAVIKDQEEEKTESTSPKIQFAKLIRRATPSDKIYFLREYCLVPALRLKNAFQSESLEVKDEYYSLKNPALVKILDTILLKHSQHYMNLRERIEPTVTSGKFQPLLDTFINSCKSVLDIANSTLLLPSQNQNDIWNAILSAILYDFLENSHGPANKLANDFINAVLSQYQVEAKAIDTEIILIEIDKLKEVEKQWFIKFLDTMSPEQRKIELTKKKLGIGELWSKGGTSLTYKYDSEEWTNLYEVAIQRGTYDDTQDTENQDAENGSNLVFVDEDGDHDGYE